MRIAVFSTKPYDRRFFLAENEKPLPGRPHELKFVKARLEANTVALAEGMDAVCAFVNDDLSAGVLRDLAGRGVKLIVLRSAGFNHVDLEVAAELGLPVLRVPAYSPHAVAEHAVALIMTLNRRIHRAYNRVREGNFALEGLLGFDMNGKTVGVVGTGQIGALFAKIMHGFGCQLLAYDVRPNPACEALDVRYVGLPEIYAQSDIISLHAPLLPATRHMINDEAVAQMKPGVMLINTSRGALIDTPAAVRGLKSGRIGNLGLDVYEEEAEVFFEDHSGEVMQDDVLARLLTFPNVIITAHQAFFTDHALEQIAGVTLGNADESAAGKPLTNAVTTS